MKIGLITDIHLGDYRRDKEFDTRKMELLKREFDSSCPEEIKEAYWKHQLIFKLFGD